MAKQVAEYFPGSPQPELVKAIERYRTYKLWKNTPVVEKAAIDQLQDMLVSSGVLESVKRVKYEQFVVTSFAAKAK